MLRGERWYIARSRGRNIPKNNNPENTMDDAPFRVKWCVTIYEQYVIIISFCDVNVNNGAYCPYPKRKNRTEYLCGLLCTICMDIQFREGRGDQKSNFTSPLSSFNAASKDFPLFLDIKPRSVGVRPSRKRISIADFGTTRPHSGENTPNLHPSL